MCFNSPEKSTHWCTVSLLLKKDEGPVQSQEAWRGKGRRAQEAETRSKEERVAWRT